MLAQVFDAPCTCFERLVTSTSGVALFDKRSRHSAASFRHASTLNARAAVAAAMTAGLVRGALSASAFPSPLVDERRDVLLIVRRGSKRVLVNEDELFAAALAAQPERLRRVALEQLPVAEQMLAVASAAVLIGVHGAGLLAFLAFLPSDVRRTACGEIRPWAPITRFDWGHLVPGVADGAGVRYFGVNAPLEPGCLVEREVARRLAVSRNCTPGPEGHACRLKTHLGKQMGQRALFCNVSVEREAFVSLVNRAAGYTAVVNGSEGATGVG